ncbi:hypothetical protein H5410_050980, partial [Solanum commersonii]
ILNGIKLKNFKQSFLPLDALARGRGQSLKSVGSVRVTAERRNLIDPTNKMLQTLRSKSAKENGQNFTSVCSSKESNVVQRMPNGKSKNYSVPASGKNEPAHNKTLCNLEIRQKFTSMGYTKGSIVVKGTSIGKSKGCSAAHSDMSERL